MAYDTIIAGAGSAGAIIATRLTEDPARRVLLIEAGADYPDFDSIPSYVKYGYGPNRDRSGVWPPDDTWYFVAWRGAAERPMLVPRGKVTGGSSAVNAQIFLRGVTDDYDAWALMGNDEWGFQEMLPYFRRIETDTDFSGDFHGSDGPIPGAPLQGRRAEPGPARLLRRRPRTGASPTAPTTTRRAPPASGRRR